MTTGSLRTCRCGGRCVLPLRLPEGLYLHADAPCVELARPRSGRSFDSGPGGACLHPRPRHMRYHGRGSGVPDHESRNTVAVPFDRLLRQRGTTCLLLDYRLPPHEGLGVMGRGAVAACHCPGGRSRCRHCRLEDFDSTAGPHKSGPKEVS